MEEMDDLNSPQLVEATLLWTGWGRSAWPLRDELQVVRRFGPEIAIKPLSTIKHLENDFYTSDARFVTTDLLHMNKLFAEQFRKRNLGIADEIVNAFAWCYTFDFK